MRGKSHRCLGKYLINHYLNDISPRFQYAFFLGCFEPDLNPATYLKGSIRCQWLRGHNYRNARRYMQTISLRLEQKDKMNLFDYYTLGKLIHYTTDAFTYAHNESFTAKLGEHKEYEAMLQDYFLQYIQDDPQINTLTAKTIIEAIYKYHLKYETETADFHTDAAFALSACCCILAILFMKPII